MAPNWNKEKASGAPPGGLYFFVDPSTDNTSRRTEKVEPGGAPDAFPI
jgi:hypothetical protein